MPQIVTPGSAIDPTLWDREGPIPKSAARSPTGTAGVKEGLANPARDGILALQQAVNNLSAAAIGATQSHVGFLGYQAGVGKEIRCVFNQPTAPTANDDSADGFSVLSIWITQTSRAFMCLSATPGAAAWVQLGGGGSTPTDPGQITPVDLVPAGTVFPVLPLAAQLPGTVYSIEAWFNATPGIGVRGVLRTGVNNKFYLYTEYGTEQLLTNPASNSVSSGMLGIGWAVNGDLVIKHGEVSNIEIAHLVTAYVGNDYMETSFPSLNPNTPTVVLSATSQVLGSRYLVEVQPTGAGPAGAAVLTVRGNGDRHLRVAEESELRASAGPPDEGVLGFFMSGNSVAFSHGENGPRGFVASVSQYQL